MSDRGPSLERGRGVNGVPEDSLTVRFLEEEHQMSDEVAGWLASFLAKAGETLDLAMYDVRLSETPARLLREALVERAAAGVRIRLAYDAGDKPQTPQEVERSGVDPTPPGTHERVEELGLPAPSIRAIKGPRELMHHKYVVRDRSAVWTGSLNLSDDSMRRMENLIVTLESQPLAAAYGHDFEQLWQRGIIEGSGEGRVDAVPLVYGGEGALTTAAFSPGRGMEINEDVALQISEARRRIVICSMLLTSSRILRAFNEQLDRGQIEIWGVYDETQMRGVLDQWQERPELAWKIAAFERLVWESRLVGKQSRPYRPDDIHDFMHNKTLVIDDTVLTGSHNFSHSAETNAENMVAIQSPRLAVDVVRYVQGLAERYGAGRQDRRHGGHS